MKKKTLVIILLSVVITNLISVSGLANYNYQIALEKGTEILKVKKYDKDAWKNTVSNFTTPNVWFEGESNNTGSRSKYVIKGWRGLTWNTYDVFISIFLPIFLDSKQIVPLLMIMNKSGYNETAINNNYTNNYKFWVGLRAKWNFTINDFDEKPIESNDRFLIFKNPEDYIKALSDYNSIAQQLNNDLTIKMSGYSFPYFDGDQFLWILIQSEFAIAKPFNKYLSILVEELGCNNATVIDNVLTIKRFGETIYTVEISYGTEGIMVSFVVKDINNVIIYQIIKTSSEWVFYIILLILSICIVVLCIFIILRRRKIMRIRKK
ncbi:MAG: hypothetical protein ACFFB0_09075 [Promethearchaeota archaeon]